MQDKYSYATADAMTLMRQAGWTVGCYLRYSVEEIDKAFGEGYAKNHPELVAEFIKACTLDAHSGAISGIAGCIIGDLREIINSAVAELKEAEMERD